MKHTKGNAAAVQNGVVISEAPVPRGTQLVSAHPYPREGFCLFEFKVCWWALPYYLGKCLYQTIKQGMKVQVRSPIERTVIQQAPHSVGTVQHNTHEAIH